MSSMQNYNQNFDKGIFLGNAQKNTLSTLEKLARNEFKEKIH